MASTLRVQAEHERPANRIHPLRAHRKRAEALEAAMPQFDRPMAYRLERLESLERLEPTCLSTA
jgi:hypothetical protein